MKQLTKRIGLGLIILIFALASLQISALAEGAADGNTVAQEESARANILVDDIEIEPDEMTLNVGATYTLQVFIEPISATNKTLNWTSTNPAVATVDGNGTVTAVSPGRADIIAMATDGSREDAECEITVVGGGAAPGNILIDDISVEPDEITLNVGASYTLQVFIQPQNATNKTLSWVSTNPAVVTVDGNGTITAVGQGRADVIASATDGSREDDECEVTVTGSGTPGTILVDDIELEPDEMTLNAGATYTLMAIVAPANATNKTLSWSSSNPAIAAVNESGLVTAVSPGVAYITAAATDGSPERDTCRVTVTSGGAGDILIHDIDVEPDDLDISVGSTYTLQAIIEPANATNKSLSWASSNPAVATVNESGLVSAVSPGVAVITASATDGSRESDSCTVRVTSGTPGNILVTDIDVEPDDLRLSVGQTYTLHTVIEPANATNKTLTWSSSSPATATVNESGFVTAVSPGIAYITAAATDGSGRRDSCEVIVASGPAAPGTVPITDIDINPDDLNLTVGATYTLQAVIEPQNATNKTLSWTSNNPNIASVTDTGLVTGVAEGVTYITAEATDGSGERDSCRVVVASGGGQPTYIPVTDVDVEPDDLNLTVGQTYTLRAHVEPANATNPAVSWTSSNNAVATVDGGGNVTAVGAGSAIITVAAADGGFTDTCLVSVQGGGPQPQPNPQEPFSIAAANPGEFTVTVSGQPADTKAVTVFAWSTPNQSDLRALQAENQNGTWICAVPVNSNKDPIVDADDITVHVYASSDPQSAGTLLGGRRYSWVNASNVAGHSVLYTAHVQNIGFVPAVYDGELAGTTGQALRLEGVRISSAVDGVSIETAAHVQDIGWMDPVGDGVYAGTTGQSKRLESVILTLSGPNSAGYTLRYRVHQQDIGWTDWVSQNQEAGVTGRSLQLEAIEVELIK